MLKRMILCANQDNDLVQAIEQSNYTVRRDQSLENALEIAGEGDVIYVAADAYPENERVITQEQIDESLRKKVRIIVEYPKQVGEKVYGEPYNVTYERMVILDEKKTGLAPMTILTINGCRVLPSEADPQCFCVAKVAGYDHAVFGLPEKVYPLMEENAGNTGITVLTTSFTRFIRAKYGPRKKWMVLWSHLLSEWTGMRVSLAWEPVVGPSYNMDEELPEQVERQAFDKSYNWFKKYIVVEEKETNRLLAEEGYLSQIDHNGKQEIRKCFRSDCFAETAMVLSLHYGLSKDECDKRHARTLLDTVWFKEEFYNNDPGTEYYGLSNWFENSKIFYGDDNARAILASLLARSALKDTRWDERLLRCLLANLRTSSHKTGFRPERIDAQENSPLFKGDKTWRDYYDEDIEHYSAHFGAYLWACFLLAYKSTGNAKFLDSAKAGIRNMMKAYPNGWRWTNSMTAEIGRMLLPLSFLARIENTPEHRGWLKLMCDEAISHMVPCGAFRDYIGIIENGKYPPPQSNDAFGTTEASLIQENGDPATDLLYAANWAFLGLHEAAAAFKAMHEPENKVAESVSKLSEFLCRIQLKKRNEDNDYLDGAWMRSFDFEKWEYWGSTADIGWGAWCVESGWVNSWISTLMLLRSQGATIYDSITDGDFGKLIDRLHDEMFEVNGQK